MRKLVLFTLLLSVVWPGSSQAQTTYLDAQAWQAIQYLNRIRQNPKAYADSTGTPSLKYAKPKAQLTPDSILMKVARKRAADMAEKNYFDHVNKEGFGVNWLMQAEGYTLEERWTRKKDFNSFESISAGFATGIEHINNLILDKGQEPPGHRQHLLGMTDFWAGCVDVGAALVHNPKSKYKYYFVIIIAFHA
jgi:uncharacterized protein YkwD